MMNDVEKGRWRRALSLSSLGAKFALGQGRRLLSRNEAAVHQQLADLLVRELGQLKGLPMKIGQILSYMEGVVPEEYSPTYRTVLAQLRTTSPAMDGATARQIFEAELGQSVDNAFLAFEAEPIASASIGQVYRGELADGPVCIKIQYPGIAEATRSDLKNMQSLVGLMRQIMPNVDTRQMIEDFRLRLDEECDYLREASYQQRFADIYADDNAIVVPGVVPELSSARVLTTRFIAGVSLESFVEIATAEERDRMGMALFRFAFGSLLRHGLFHADPHPGNLLFNVGEAGRLGVLDYGCVQPIDEAARVDMAQLFHHALADRPGRPLAPAIERALGIDAIDDATREVMVELCREALAPVLQPQPFQFTTDYAKRIGGAMVDAKMKLASKFLTRRAHLSVKREGVMFVVRNLYGLASIWGVLESRGDFRAATEALLLD